MTAILQSIIASQKWWSGLAQVLIWNMHKWMINRRARMQMVSFKTRKNLSSIEKYFDALQRYNKFYDSVLYLQMLWLYHQSLLVLIRSTQLLIYLPIVYSRDIRSCTNGAAATVAVETGRSAVIRVQNVVDENYRKERYQSKQLSKLNCSRHCRSAIEWVI